MTARDYTAAALELGVSEKWLRENTPRVPLPHHKFAVTEDGVNKSRTGRGAVVFYDDDIAAIKELFAVRPAEASKPTSPESFRALGRGRRAS